MSPQKHDLRLVVISPCLLNLALGVPSLIF